MHKIPTLLKKNPNDLGLVIKELTEGLPSPSELQMRVKWDGQACLIRDGKLFTRYDAKPRYNKKGQLKQAKSLPKGSIECQAADPISGHHPYWVPVEGDTPQYKWVAEAFINSLDKGLPLDDGTYEAIGPHHQSNPHGLEEDILQSHAVTLQDMGYELKLKDDAADLYDQLQEFFKDFPFEGIVLYAEGVPVAKIRRSDFGYKKLDYARPNLGLQYKAA